jgi:hypothetical protein
MNSFLVIAASIYSIMAQVPPASDVAAKETNVPAKEATRIEYPRPVNEEDSYRHLMERTYPPPKNHQEWIALGGAGGPWGWGFRRPWGCGCGGWGCGGCGFRRYWW